MTERIETAGWEIERHGIERPDSETGTFMEWRPSGLSWGRCTCGYRAQDVNGDPVPHSNVVDALRDHIAAEHPDWPEERRP